MNRLKADYKFDDKYTNLGILLSPTINIPSNEDLLVDIIVYTEMSPSPINLHLNGRFLPWRRIVASVIPGTSLWWG